MKEAEGEHDRAQQGPRAEADHDPATQRALKEGDKEKIDGMLDDLDVSTTESGKDQTKKPDTEGSNSSSKNMDEQRD